MLYELTRNLDGIFNLFRYITFRTGGALLTSLFIYLIFGERFINFVKTKFHHFYGLIYPAAMYG